LAATGARVGLLDGDIYGPNLPRMLGVRKQPGVRDGQIVPVEVYGIRFISIGLLVDQGEAVVWRGPMLHGVIKQLLKDVDWGALGVPYLGGIPLHASVRQGGDEGRPVVIAEPDSAYARALSRIAGSLAQRVSIQTIGQP